MQTFKFKHPEVIIILCALLAGGVFSFGLSVLLLPLVFGGYLLTIANLPKSAPLKRTLWLSSLFNFVFYAMVLIWFMQTDIELLAGLNSTNAPLLLGLCLVIMAFVLTLASLPFATFLHYMRNRLLKPAVIPVAAIASAWAITEWIRSLVFSIFLWAPGASMGDYWNFGSLGLGAMSSPIAILSRYVGMYGLSMIVVLFSIFIVWAIKKQPRYLLGGLIIITLATLIAHADGRRQSSLRTLKASVQQREKAIGEDVGKTTGFKYLDDSDKSLIVLTEYSNLHTPGSEHIVRKFITNRLADDGVSIDVTADFTQRGVRYNTLVARDKSGELIDKQTKQLLIPTGEYLPIVLQIFYKVTGQDSINQNFAQTRQLYRGQPPRVIETKELAIAPVACSGILGRNIYRQLVSDGGEVLTNSASLLIFSGSQSYFQQSLQMARFHAISNQRTYIQASMGAPAFVVSDSGAFIIEPEDTQSAFIDFSFTPLQQKTFYTKYGEWTLEMAGIFLSLLLVTSTATYMQGRRKH